MSAAVILSEARNSLRQHLRSKALWFLGLATPVAANFMVPESGADYAVVTVNNAYPVLNPAMLGLELGVITASLLTPAAYLFLRAGPTRTRPIQITDVAPYSRISAAIGRCLADVGVLWLLLGALTVAGWVLGFFRLETGQWNFLDSATTLWLVAAPSLVLVAAFRTFLASRPALSRWPGDVLFVVIWITSMIFGIIASDTITGGAMQMKPMADPLGFVTPIIVGSPVPVHSFSIGSSADVTTKMDIDALGGVLNAPFILSRIAWIGIALALAMFSGLVYKSRKPRVRKTGRIATKLANYSEAHALAKMNTISQSAMVPARTASVPYVGAVASEIKLIFKDKIWLIFVLAAAVLGALMPYREVAAPAIWLALLFPLTTQSGRWQARSLRGLLSTSVSTEAARAVIFCTAGIAVMFAAHIPAIGKSLAGGDTAQILLMAKLILAIPITAAVLAYLSRGAIVGRLILLIAWYVFLSSA